MVDFKDLNAKCKLTSYKNRNNIYSVKKMHVPDGAVPLGYGQGSTY